MPYLNLDPNYFDHSKTRRLIAILGPGSDIFPIRLWAYCARHHPKDGTLKGYRTVEIEGLIGWLGTRGEAVGALKRVCFIAGSERAYRCVDWVQHEGHLVAFSRRGKAAANARWAKYATSMPQAMQKHHFSNAPSVPAVPAVPAVPTTPTNVAPEAAQETEVIKPETPIQAVIRAYKHAKNIPMYDKSWDQANFGRYSKSAKNLLSCFGDDVKICATYIFTRAEELKEKNLEWTLETISRHAFDGLGLPDTEKTDESKPVPMDANSVPGRKRNKRFTRAGEMVGDTLAQMRKQSEISSRGKTDLDGTPNNFASDESPKS